MGHTASRDVWAVHALHSALGLTPRDSKHKGKESVTAAKRAEFAGVRLLVIDEISMAGEKLLKQVDKKLQELRIQGVPFGGISVLFVRIQ